MAPKEPRVLVIDADHGMQDLLRMALEDEGYRVTLATDRMALPLARDQQPDVIVLDLELPNGDGEVICRGLAADQRTAGIPIVGLAGEGEAIDWWKPGPSHDRLNLPFQLATLYAKVEHWATTKAP